MATETFPSYGTLLDTPIREQPASALIRTRMDGGYIKQARVKRAVLVQRPVTYEFTKAELATWETWFKTNINDGADWFNWTDPRTEVSIEVRIVGGLYQSVAVDPLLDWWRVSMTLESKRA